MTQSVTIGVEEMLNEVKIDEYYRNKKNQKLYYVENFVKHSETLETMVLYFPYDNINESWVRPLELFKEKFVEM